jgi:hypothetical protein
MANKLDNLKPFEKGQSGNPNGRPKGAISSKTILNKFLSLVEKGVKNPVTGEFEDMTVAEVMNLSIIAKARKGDLSAYREVLDRLEGKPQQNIDHTTGGEKIDNKFEIEILTNKDEAQQETD